MAVVVFIWCSLCCLLRDRIRKHHSPGTLVGFDSGVANSIVGPRPRLPFRLKRTVESHLRFERTWGMMCGICI